MANYCDDCGCKVIGGLCTNCQEDAFIADQHRELGTYQQTSPEFKQKEEDALRKTITSHERKNIFDQ